jgi:hypothetical protein
MLCVGSFEDIDLAEFRRQHPQRLNTYDIVFSTSVIEHVPDDETFVADMVAMLAPGGYAVLTPRSGAACQRGCISAHLGCISAHLRMAWADRASKCCCKWGTSNCWMSPTGKTTSRTSPLPRRASTCATDLQRSPCSVETSP